MKFAIAFGLALTLASGNYTPSNIVDPNWLSSRYTDYNDNNHFKDYKDNKNYNDYNYKDYKDYKGYYNRCLSDETYVKG